MHTYYTLFLMSYGSKMITLYSQLLEMIPLLLVAFVMHLCAKQPITRESNIYSYTYVYIAIYNIAT